MMATAVASVRFYAVRKPLAAFFAGAAIALLAGLIGLGGAEFRLPVLIMMFALFAHRAIRINLLISLATLAAASFVRLRLIPSTQVPEFIPEIIAMAAAGVAAAWVGAGMLERIARDRILPVIAVLLALIAALLASEAFLRGVDGLSLSSGPIRAVLALGFGIVIGAVSSLLGVAGGEFIIPTLVLVFGADIRTAGTASVLISLPIVLTGVGRHFLAGKYRSTTMLGYLVLPMSLGSIAGAVAGGYVSLTISQSALRLILAVILAASAIKLWRKRDAGYQREKSATKPAG
jgi:uncharacterized membrane protein YfcA